MDHVLETCLYILWRGEETKNCHDWSTRNSSISCHDHQRKVRGQVYINKSVFPNRSCNHRAWMFLFSSTVTEPCPGAYFGGWSPRIIQTFPYRKQSTKLAIQYLSVFERSNQLSSLLFQYLPTLLFARSISHILRSISGDFCLHNRTGVELPSRDNPIDAGKDENEAQKGNCVIHL
jgi:hypothetical protein